MNAKRDTIHKMKMVALKQAWATSKNNGDYLPYIKQLHQKDLECLAIDGPLTGANHVRIITNGSGGRACPACSKMGDKVFPLQTELISPHLPVARCTCTGHEDHQTGFCLCHYEHVWDDEL